MENCRARDSFVGEIVAMVKAAHPRSPVEPPTGGRVWAVTSGSSGQSGVSQSRPKVRANLAARPLRYR